MYQTHIKLLSRLSNISKCINNSCQGFRLETRRPSDPPFVPLARTNPHNHKQHETSCLDKFDVLLAFDGKSSLSRIASFQVVHAYVDCSCPIRPIGQDADGPRAGPQLPPGHSIIIMIMLLLLILLIIVILTLIITIRTIMIMMILTILTQYNNHTNHNTNLNAHLDTHRGNKPVPPLPRRSPCQKVFDLQLLCYYNYIIMCLIIVVIIIIFILILIIIIIIVIIPFLFLDF